MAWTINRVLSQLDRDDRQLKTQKLCARERGERSIGSAAILLVTLRIDCVAGSAHGEGITLINSWKR